MKTMVALEVNMRLNPEPGELPQLENLRAGLEHWRKVCDTVNLWTSPEGLDDGIFAEAVAIIRAAGMDVLPGLKLDAETKQPGTNVRLPLSDPLVWSRFVTCLRIQNNILGEDPDFTLIDTESPLTRVHDGTDKPLDPARLYNALGMIRRYKASRLVLYPANAGESGHVQEVMASFARVFVERTHCHMTSRNRFGFGNRSWEAQAYERSLGMVSTPDYTRARRMWMMLYTYDHTLEKIAEYTQTAKARGDRVLIWYPGSTRFVSEGERLAGLEGLA